MTWHGLMEALDKGLGDWVLLILAALYLWLEWRGQRKEGKR